jgi:hypothetical protein
MEQHYDGKNYIIKERLVREGKSKVFKNWHEHTGVSMDDFLEALRWVCEDPCNGGFENRCRTREIICGRDGKIMKCHRLFGFWHWEGCDPAGGEYGFMGYANIETGMRESYMNHKAGLSCYDRV